MAETAREEELLDRARAGDRAALSKLLERHEPRILRFGRKMCGDPEDAKDVLQETLIAMARSVGDFRGSSSMTTWAYTIARSFCIKKRRRSKFAPQEERSLDEPRLMASLPADEAPDPEARVASAEIHRALERAIDALEPKYREVLVLRDVEGLPAAEVAEVLGLGVEAVKSRLHRARLSVRTAIGPLLAPPAAPRAPGKCPDVLELLSRSLEGQIGPETCAAMERHLEVCPHCRGACDSLRRTLALCRELPPAAVPPEVQIAVREAVQRFLRDGATRA